MNEKKEIEKLFKDNYTRMYTFAFSILKDSDLSRDIVHDIFAEMIEDPTKWKTDPGYLHRSVRNRCINHIRDISNRQRIERLIRIESTDEAAEIDDACDRAAEIIRIIRTCLPTQCSRVMSLRFEKDLTYKEISEIMEISDIAVYKHLRHGLELIRKNIKR